MIALTLHQPWANLVALGHKRFETRDWVPPESLMRLPSGHLAIHAGKALTVEGRELFFECRHRGLNLGCNRPEDLPLGEVVAVAHPVYAYNTEFLTGPGRHVWRAHAAPLEELFGDFSAGRFAWLLGDVRPVRPPIPCRGFQKLWRLPDDVAATIAARGVTAPAA